MAREKKIIDASIAVKWFANEPGSEEAVRLRSEHINGKIVLVAPELIFLEVLNALRYKKAKTNLAEANASLWELQIHVEKLNQNLLDKTVENALKYNLSIYDAIYLTLAQFHGAPLITADDALAKAPNTILLK